MKRVVIVALIGLNLALLAALGIQAVRPAQAQDDIYYRRTNYVMVVGQSMGGKDIIYVIDVASQRLGAWEFDESTKRLKAYRGRELGNDFRLGGN